ncbi:antibiotic biosynthesis monooxygenase [Shewanella ulleungensis]|uniref:Antibiotic biosynthesis monooxygenase n=1 Tax=Shewanella ulleungensis TaxID=2282699 RepID=A0ABQ2QCN1_9GAMM|nr:antibiotic biosynthesis monooxygenase [Shewanella ulleungensis]MCL1148855.1 antibiotic biosynthesis monooxygenase [Shewanella ulleungensis]GGP75185.1 antibiotic biosynthesis monooxygenase [Shewanella ulleungensis]
MAEQNAVNSDNHSEVSGVSIIIRHKVRLEYRARYEEWLTRIISAAAKFPGHNGVHILRPLPDKEEFEISVRFACEALAYNWLQSMERKALLEQISSLFQGEEQLEIYNGIDFWFTQPSVQTKVATRWKQWLITTAIIWPLTMLIPVLLKLVYKYLSLDIYWVIQQGIAVSIIVALVVYIIMPRVVKVVASWLFSG